MKTPILTRKQINQYGLPHDEKFVKYKDMEDMLNNFIKSAVKAGADVDKLIEIADKGGE